MNNPDSYRLWLDAVGAADAKGKLFVCGCAKSGTTWLMNCLSGHPEIIISGEGRWGWTLAPIIFKAFDFFNEEHDKVGGHPAARIGENERLRVLRTIINSGLARYIDAGRAGKPGFRFVGDKTPQHTVCLPLLSAVFPEARFVNIVRDPRDAAVSAWFHKGFRREGHSFDDHVRDYVSNVWPANVMPVRRAARALSGRVLELRYEDMLADEEKVLACAMEFIGADASEASIRACMEAGDFKRRSGGRARGQKDSASFYRSGTAGDWKEHIRPELAADCTRKVSALMLEYGYEI